MGEHVHEWHVETIEYEGMYITCMAEGKCDMQGGPSDEEIARRLNATERLSADAAKAIVQDAQEDTHLRIAHTHYLIAYASALDGEDE